MSLSPALELLKVTTSMEDIHVDHGSLLISVPLVYEGSGTSRNVNYEFEG